MRARDGGSSMFQLGPFYLLLVIWTRPSLRVLTSVLDDRRRSPFVLGMGLVGWPVRADLDPSLVARGAAVVRHILLIGGGGLKDHVFCGTPSKAFILALAGLLVRSS